MSWDDLLKHSYLNYDHTKFMDPGFENKEDLMLSYNNQSGIY